MNEAQTYIKRCLQLAELGLPQAMPNPSVGAVIVHNNVIIGEGYTSAYGGNHAEVNAINAVKDKTLLSKSILYVSLEPCCHFGKTPPCTDLILKYKIPQVIIGSVDSNKKVSGKGIKQLMQEGVDVKVGFLEKECLELNKRFFNFHNKKRPYIVLKWAESYDGFIAPQNQMALASYNISNEISRQLAHKWRSEEQSILVGTNTVLKDNPKLDVRFWSGTNPVRIVLDKMLSIDNSYHVTNNLIKTIVFTQRLDSQPAKNIFYETVLFDDNLAQSICDVLIKHEIQSVLIEGGAKTLQLFIDGNLWNEARIFKSDKLLFSGVKSPKIILQNFKKTCILDDTLITVYNQKD
ncbi:MAG: bifunctional diaminohydroxyphosphoribosylaminopyrimidine deaminase/5-amino-6-(5-phosphoribosylamino)uracil reductase RibD [Flavobacterium sp.]|nr:bifunctional diaminohydroxyphosphoribosylaminopyrimidine deaminase/5-amino-6-(5-phosphoribosylamino)uracil reductase RibD [Flavobacterium sp.]